LLTISNAQPVQQKKHLTKYYPTFKHKTIHEEAIIPVDSRISYFRSAGPAKPCKLEIYQQKVIRKGI
jgi:hypothetical protein